MRNIIDVNAMTGHWPFRQLKMEKLAYIDNVFRTNGVCKAFISSFNSVFYNDPYCGDVELHEEIESNERYAHVLTVNPMLPGWRDDIERAIDRMQISGVKVFPTYHSYNLCDGYVKELIDVLKGYKLPVFIVMRLEDERLNYLWPIKPLDIDDIKEFIKGIADVPAIFLQPLVSEVLQVKDFFQGDYNCYFDTSGLRHNLFTLEKLLEQKISPGHILFGSLYPMLCFYSSYYIVDKAVVQDDVKDKIFYENAKNILNCRIQATSINDGYYKKINYYRRSE